MKSTPKVLVYDDAFDTSEVLAAVYRPRGFEVERVSTRESHPPFQRGRGSVVVLRSPTADDDIADHPPLKVIVGRMAAGPAQTEARNVAACRISSLFDYRELVSAIDRLLCGSD
ncbi:hypothetical protein Pan44_29380 [Caulifigura coniformis]|uniref:Uncharacterized protein n=1 Tax=Caulifigura coniformis TaxID=2527983 RepID=A0A517SFJ8_9PLAN|nr:hypothetical protein [Caulifigura coniformis]QDT54899.1 hypothetical protein Pan44_29380 [Caulifigura coniformis]